jgi:hypothetical protein
LYSIQEAIGTLVAAQGLVRADEKDKRLKIYLDLGSAHFDAGRIHEEAGSAGQAASAYDAALAVFTQAAQLEPSSQEGARQSLLPHMQVVFALVVY